MPSTRTARTKRIPSNPKRTNNKPKLLPVINSYCFQDEPKCHWSLSRNSNYGVSLLLLWQVLELLGNIEKEQHRWLQCSAFLGFLLKTQKSTTLWKEFVPFFEYRISCIKWFCLPMFRPKLWHRRAREKKKTTQTTCFNIGRQIHLMGRRPKHL